MARDKAKNLDCTLVGQIVGVKVVLLLEGSCRSADREKVKKTGVKV